MHTQACMRLCLCVFVNLSMGLFVIRVQRGLPSTRSLLVYFFSPIPLIPSQVNRQGCTRCAALQHWCISFTIDVLIYKSGFVYNSSLKLRFSTRCCKCRFDARKNANYPPTAAGKLRSDRRHRAWGGGVCKSSWQYPLLYMIATIFATHTRKCLRVSVFV